MDFSSLGFEIFHAFALAADTTFLLIFVLLAIYFTKAQLKPGGFWLSLGLVYAGIVLARIFLMLGVDVFPLGFAQMLQALLFLSAALAFSGICASENMVDHHPAFWIPAYLVMCSMWLAAGVKVLATIFLFTGLGFASVVTTIATILGIFAIILFLLLVGGNLYWLKDPL